MIKPAMYINPKHKQTHGPGQTMVSPKAGKRSSIIQQCRLLRNTREKHYATTKSGSASNLKPIRMHQHIRLHSCLARRCSTCNPTQQHMPHIHNFTPPTTLDSYQCTWPEANLVPVSRYVRDSKSTFSGPAWLLSCVPWESEPSSASFAAFTSPAAMMSIVSQVRSKPLHRTTPAVTVAYMRLHSKHQ